jgi:hypothetical protein
MSLPSAHAFSWAEVCARRLERGWLASPSEDGRPADIVRAMCGAHAQVFAAAELSVGIRSRGISQAEVRWALWEERSLVKTYGPRGTVHVLAGEDLSLWTGALGAIPPPAAIRDRFLTPGQTDEVIVAIAGSLRTDELTAAELGEAVVGRTGPWAGELVIPAFSGMWPRWRAALAQAAFRGALPKFPQDAEPRSLQALIPAWKSGIDTIIVLPYKGYFAQRLSRRHLVVSADV